MGSEDSSHSAAAPRGIALPQETNRETFDLNTESPDIDSRQIESNKNRASVLIGSSILQLPIWGKLKFIPLNTNPSNVPQDSA